MQVPNSGNSGDAGLHTWADVATIITGFIAVVAYFQLGMRRFRHRLKLEHYLRAERPGQRGRGDTGARTQTHLAAALKMSESDIMDAAFRSKHIERVVDADPQTNRARAILLRYSKDRSTPEE